VITDPTDKPVVTLCEPVLVVFQNILYCFYVNTSNLVQYVALESTGPAGVLPPFIGSTDKAPAVTVDPTGTLLLTCVKLPGSGGRSMVYAWTNDFNTWTPQGVAGQVTSQAPVLFASNTGAILLAFHSGTNNSIFCMNPLQYWYLPSGVNAVPAS
jgi:hypothetical protein